MFITGGSSGIGEALTKRIVQLNPKKVIISARRIEELERVKKECDNPSIVQPFILDLSDPEKCLAECTKFFEKEQVDIVINNGGQSQRSLFENTGYTVVSKLMNINCLSPIAICKAVFPGMQKRKSGQIVNVLSVCGYL